MKTDRLNIAAQLTPSTPVLPSEITAVDIDITVSVHYGEGQRDEVYLSKDFTL